MFNLDFTIELFEAFSLFNVFYFSPEFVSKYAHAGMYSFCGVDLKFSVVTLAPFPSLKFY